MTNINMSNANTEVNFIRMSDIVQRDGKTGELFQNIGAVHDDGASFDEIVELEKELAELEARQPDYEYIVSGGDKMSKSGV